MNKAKAKRITLEDLAAMTKNGFDEMGEKIDGVEEKIGGVEKELKEFREENSREHEEIKLRLVQLLSSNLPKIAFSFFLVFLFLYPAVSRAAAFSVKVTNPISTSSFSEIVANFLLWALSVAGSLALLMLVAGGIMYITSTGDEQRATVAKKIITWTILGLSLILVSYAIIVVLDSILT